MYCYSLLWMSKRGDVLLGNSCMIPHQYVSEAFKRKLFGRMNLVLLLMINACAVFILNETSLDFFLFHL